MNLKRLYAHTKSQRHKEKEIALLGGFASLCESFFDLAVNLIRLGAVL